MKNLTIELYDVGTIMTRLLLDGEPLGTLLELHFFAVGDQRGLKAVFADTPGSADNARKLADVPFAEVLVRVDNSPGIIPTEEDLNSSSRRAGA
jgi:hypothetical protein